MSFIELIFEKQDTFLTLKCIKVVTNTKLYNLKYHLIYELAFQYSFSFRIVIKSFSKLEDNSQYMNLQNLLI